MDSFSTDQRSDLSREDILEYYADAYPNPSVLSLQASPIRLRDILPLWEEYLASPPNDREPALHLHVPFCRAKCSFCDCSSDTLHGPGDLAAYLEGVMWEMETLAPFFQGFSFCRLYVGGGTPNLLPDRMLARILEQVVRRFETRPGAVRSIEFAPELTRCANLRIARNAGFDRISFGVQTLTPGVLPDLGRPHASPDSSQRAFSLAREAGFREINVDLIFGLGTETPEQFHRGLMAVLSWGPETVTVQLVHDSQVSQVYRDPLHRHAVEEVYVHYVRDRLRFIDRAFPDYTCQVRPGTCVLLHRRMPRPWREWLDFYSYRERDPISTLGLGPMAHSKMFGRMGYQGLRASTDPTSWSYCYQSYSLELEAFIEAACALVTRGRFSLEDVVRCTGMVPPRLEAEIERLVAEGGLTSQGGNWVGRRGARNPLLPAIERLARECESQGIRTPLKRQTEP